MSEHWQNEWLVVRDALDRKSVDLWINGDRVVYENADAVIAPEEAEFLDRWNPQLVHLLRQGDQILRSFPLSIGQRGLLYLHELMPNNPSYHLAFPIRVHSPVDTAALQRALQTLVNRHTCLRTLFEPRARGEPLQHILGYRELPLESVDCFGMDDETLRSCVTGRHAAPFDLEHTLPVRAHLFTRAVDDHVFMLNIHHIVTDGISLWTLLADLREAYSAEVAGRAPQLRPLGASYSEFVSWQQDMLAGPEGEANLEFWRDYLDGAPAILDLPTDRKRPLRPTGDGGMVMFKLDQEMTDQVTQFATAAAVKVRTIFLAAYQLLLHRYSGQDDVLIAFETAGRPGLRLARTAGFFVDPIVLRSSLSAGEASLDFLRRQEANMTTVLEHQSLPFVYLVENLDFDRDARYWPLVQAEFNFYRQPRRPQFEELMIYVDEPRRADFGGLTVSSYGLIQQVGQQDIGLSFSQVREEYWGGLKYNTDLFDSDYASRMIEHYKAIVRFVVSTPESPVDRLSLMTPQAERDALQHCSNVVPRRGFPPVSRMFEGQTAATPDAIAVVCDNSSISYRDLNRRANQLAAELVEMGVGRDRLVGVCLDRSITMVVALLAILKAGGAYMPLDPALPASRMDFMVHDAGVSVLLTESGVSDRLPDHSARIVHLDEPRPPLSESGSNPQPEPGPDDLAYVVYTSGSTGKPKGVQVTHRALTNLLLAAKTRPGLIAQDVVLAVTTLSFDIAAMEIFLPLIVGARVVIARDDETHDGRLLANMIDERDITFMQATPATWRMLVDAGWEGRPEMKAVSGGEVLTPSLAGRLLERLGSLWNGYGPSEATIYATFHEVRSGEDPIPIGTPVDNTTVYVLDDDRQLVPRGLPGELYLGGIGLARGYLDRESLTTERFVPDPFTTEPGARMYRTGDLVRMRAGGALEFLGRADHQVKLRGFRIELGEIENALEHHPSVRQAVVTTSEDERGHQRLVGSIVPEAASPPIADVKEFLRRQLPEYMIPAVWHIVDSFPMTPSGKVDRRALAALEPQWHGSEREIQGPSTPTERNLDHLWRSLLGGDLIDVHDRFQDIGGDSITLAEMVVRAAEMFGVELSLNTVFEHQSIHTLAQVIDDRSENRESGPRGAEADIRLALDKSPTDGRAPRRPLLQPFMLAGLRLLTRVLARVSVAGVDDLPPAGPRIVAANHINWLDFPFLAAALSRTVLANNPRPAFVAAIKWKKLFHPVYIAVGRPIYVRKGPSDLEALAAFTEILRSDGVVAIAPEGTFNRGGLLRGKTGTARVAAATGAPIIPVVAYGQGEALRYWRRLRRVPIEIRIGPPIWVRPGISDQMELQRETDRLMEAIARLLPVGLRGVYGYVADSTTSTL